MSPEQRANDGGMRLAREVHAELGRIEAVADQIRALASTLTADSSPIVRMAAAGYLHSFYTGCEAVLGRIARAFDRLPGGERWHVRLLLDAAAPIEGVRPPVIRPETAVALDDLRQFRHFFRTQYGVELRVEELLKHARSVPEAWVGFQRDVVAFLALVERAGEATGES